MKIWKWHKIENGHNENEVKIIPKNIGFLKNFSTIWLKLFLR